MAHPCPYNKDISKGHMTNTNRRYDLTAAEQEAIQKTIPNMTHPDAPVGRDDASNKVAGYGKTEPRKFDFKPLDHVALGEKLDLFDLERGSRGTGHGF